MTYDSNGTLKVDVDGLGLYSLRVTDVNGCTNTSNSALVKDSASGKCFIYPNPTSGQVNFSLEGVSDREIIHVIPRYYDRGANGIPLRWLEVMRRAMATALWQFSTTRMLHEYTERLYLPAAGIVQPETDPRPVVTEAG